MIMGIIGLGKMGTAIGYRAIQAGHTIFGFDPDKSACLTAAQSGIKIVTSIVVLTQETSVFWIMVPAGESTTLVINQLTPLLTHDSIIIDGGNSHYKDSILRASTLLKKGVFFLDCGTSGGVAGREHGFCLMIGGNREIYAKIYSLLTAIAAPGGLAHVGPSGTGHYIKMVHNGIEYGILQAYAEGFHLLKKGSFAKERLNLEEISRIWNASSVIRSYLLKLAHNIFEKDQELSSISGEVDQGATGNWTVEEAHKQNIPIPVIESSVRTRTESRKNGGNYTTKIIAMLRNQFGGHGVKTQEK